MKLQRIRNEKGLTQNELARMTGISRVNISRYETETNNIPIKNALKIAAVLGCTIDELFEREEEAAREGGEG